MIITSVVPPELPMELSLAVTNSLAALSRNLVFCTEPFRIPYAGKLDVRTTQSVSINNSESDWYGTRIYDDGDDSGNDEYTNLLQSLLCFLALSLSISYNTPSLNHYTISAILF